RSPSFGLLPGALNLPVDAVAHVRQHRFADAGEAAAGAEGAADAVAAVAAEVGDAPRRVGDRPGRRAAGRIAGLAPVGGVDLAGDVAAAVDLAGARLAGAADAGAGAAETGRAADAVAAVPLVVVAAGDVVVRGRPFGLAEERSAKLALVGGI